MDIKRAPPPKKKKYLLGAGAIAGIVLVTVAINRLEPAAPTVERATLMIDSVRRGTMVREVHAPGVLTPEHVKIIAAVTAGRVEQLPLRAGVPVTPTTLLVELSNPDVQLQLLEAQRALTAAQGALLSQQTSLRSQRLNQEATIAGLRTQLNDAKRQLEAAEGLDKKGLSSAYEMAAARDRVRELTERERLAREQLNLTAESAEREIALQAAQVQRLRSIVQFQQGRVGSMMVLAGENGVLQELPLELGQWVNPGMILARVSQPGRLKAVLRVPETQAKDITVGQRTSIDTRNGIVPGRVMRVDPAAQNGTVTVEIALEGELPRGARPDLSVDGTIEIERLIDVMYVGRPAYGQAESTVGLFKLEPDGKNASRVNVRLGRASVNTIQVLQGLGVGEKVIISDMSAYDNTNKVRLK
ncbi:MAG: HlyD family efflux transporter periplasmic adaptor subunit [Gemmatimonadota bacterium]|nr:HlyD family efflux transporter periplasmic adaptor subunit [Gemmatimonadota bacterium]